MRRLHALYFVFLSLGLAWPASAAPSALPSAVDAPHLRVELLVLPQSLNRGQTAQAGLYFKLEPGWHIYWKNAGDAGDPPHAVWTLPAGITASPLRFPAPKRLPLGPLMDYGYEDEVLFPLDLHVAPGVAPGPALLHAKVDWLVCRGTCLPGKAELELSRDVASQSAKSVTLAAEAALFRHWLARIPQPPPAGLKASFVTTKENFQLAVTTGRRETEATFFPADEYTLENPAPQKLTPTATGFELLLKKDASLTAPPAHLNGVLELSGGRAYELAVAPAAPLGTSAGSLVPIPNFPITERNPGAGRFVIGTALPAQPNSLLKISALAFLGGLLLNLMPCVFPVLFLKGLALVRSGNEERRTLRLHGAVYTAGILVCFWILVAVLLGLRSAGATLGWGFQFQSPIFLALMAGLLFFLGLSLAGQFEIGLSVTSTGSSLAARQGYAGSFFTGVLAVVVATPCTAPMMGAAIGYALAQPAAVTFAVFTALALGLAAPYVALTLRPGWTRWLPRPGVWMEVLRQAVSVPIFATVIWLAWVLARAYGAELVAALLAGFLLLAVAGWFLGRWPMRRWASLVALAIALLFIALCVAAPASLGSSAPGPATQASDWEPWSPAAVSRYQAQGKTVFVDFTASWCLSCQVNEKTALDRPEVRQAFASSNVVRMRADWTRHDEAITRELAALGRSGVPTYAVYAAHAQQKPELLPEVLTPSIVLEKLKALAAYAAR